MPWTPQTYEEIKQVIPALTDVELHKFLMDARRYPGHPGERDLANHLEAEKARRMSA